MIDSPTYINILVQFYYTILQVLILLDATVKYCEQEKGIGLTQ